MNRILYSHEAKEDLQGIKTYYEVELRKTSAATKVLNEITKRIRTLEDFPRSGRKLSAIIDIETDYRFIGCGNYLAFYRITGNDILIVRVIHNRRDYISILYGELPNNEHIK